MEQLDYGEHRHAGKLFDLLSIVVRDLLDQKYAEEYFSANNSLSKKILEDISDLRNIYEDAWEGMDQEERDQVKVSWEKLKITFH